MVGAAWGPYTSRVITCTLLQALAAIPFQIFGEIVVGNFGCDIDIEHETPSEVPRAQILPLGNSNCSRLFWTVNL